MFPNLALELKRKGITYKAVAGLLQCTEKTFQNKMSGATEFTLKEILLICDNLLPEFELRYLFARADAA